MNTRTTIPALDQRGDAPARRSKMDGLQVALAEQDRAQAAVLDGWARDLETAQKAGDWQAVARVREGISATADMLGSFAGELAALMGLDAAHVEGAVTYRAPRGR